MKTIEFHTPRVVLTFNKLMQKLAKIFLTLCLGIYSFQSLGQCPETNPRCHDADHWIFGDSVYIQFTDTGLVVGKKPCFSYEASSSLTDRKGNLILYSNGIEIFDNRDSVIAKTSLGHWSSTQGVHFERFGDDSTVFVLLGNEEYYSDTMRYAIATLNLNRGTIVDSTVLLYPSTEKIGRVLHQNQQDVWVAMRQNHSNRILLFLLKPEGLLCCPKVGLSPDTLTGTKYVAGQLKFSPNGSHLAITASGVKFFDFNSQSGELTYRGRTRGNYGVEFSSSSNNLFFSTGGVIVKPIDSFRNVSWLTEWEYAVANSSVNSGRGGLQLGPNDKIYVARIGHRSLEFVHNPDTLYDFTRYSYTGVALDSTTNSGYSLPSFNASTFYTPAADFAYEHECGSTNYTFSGRDTLNATNHYWLITNDNTGKTIDRFGKVQKVSFPEPISYKDTYHVRYIAYSNKGVDTVIKKLNIYRPLKTNFLGEDTFFCTSESVVLRVPDSMHCVHWNGKEPNYDTRHGSIVDYDEFHVDTMVVDKPGTYFVRATNRAFCKQWDTITISERLKPTKPKISDNTGELASDLVGSKYRWYVNDTFLLESVNRSIKPPKNGYYQVRLVSTNGCVSEASDSFLYDKLGTPVIEKQTITFYPNPTHGIVTITLKQPEKFDVEAYDKVGRRVFTRCCFEGSKGSVYLESPGLYLIRITTESHFESSKLIYRE